MFLGVRNCPDPTMVIVANGTRDRPECGLTDNTQLGAPDRRKCKVDRTDRLTRPDLSFNRLQLRLTLCNLSLDRTAALSGTALGGVIRG